MTRTPQAAARPKERTRDEGKIIGGACVAPSHDRPTVLDRTEEPFGQVTRTRQIRAEADWPGTRTIERAFPLSGKFLKL
jgi:hypothetical protein